MSVLPDFENGRASGERRASGGRAAGNSELSVDRSFVPRLPPMLFNSFCIVSVFTHRALAVGTRATVPPDLGSNNQSIQHPQVVMCMARPKAGKPGQPGLRCLSQARPWGAALQAHRPGLRILKPGPGHQATALSACGSQDLPTFCPSFPLISTPAHFFFPLAFPLPFPPFSGGGLLAHRSSFRDAPTTSPSNVSQHN